MNAQYSDIKSTGGMDPRNEYEAARNYRPVDVDAAAPAPKQHYKTMIVEVDVRDVDTDQTLVAYSTDLANDQMRRVFAEQMSNAYAGGQDSVVVPSKVIPK